MDPVLSLSQHEMQSLQQQVTLALEEDLSAVDPTLDITAQLIDSSSQSQASIITREPMVLCGSAWVDEIFRQLDPAVSIEWQADDGDWVDAQQILCHLSGSSCSLLTGERAALNFLQTLSATATLTARYSAKLQGSATRLLDTRKTLPGLRLAQKYAVRCGGGKNHRIGLYDAYLIKENHIAASGGIASAVAKARQLNPTKPVEVEVENLAELQQALGAQADIIMLDNFSLADVQQAVNANRQAQKPALLEVSGNITDSRLDELKATGVDFISSGALTKNVIAIDLSMRIS
ncbi:MAG: carboxylating nicotinate-nucleotide diphosphorylase [Pseudomonadota bacterium]